MPNVGTRANRTAMIQRHTGSFIHQMFPTMFPALFEALGENESLSSWGLHLEWDMKVETEISKYGPGRDKWYQGK